MSVNFGFRVFHDKLIPKYISAVDFYSRLIKLQSMNRPSVRFIFLTYITLSKALNENHANYLDITLITLDNCNARQMFLLNWESPIKIRVFTYGSSAVFLTNYNFIFVRAGYFNQYAFITTSYVISINRNGYKKFSRTQCAYSSIWLYLLSFDETEACMVISNAIYSYEINTKNRIGYMHRSIIKKRVSYSQEIHLSRTCTIDIERQLTINSVAQLVM